MKRHVSSLFVLLITCLLILSLVPEGKKNFKKAPKRYDQPEAAMSYYVKRHTGRDGMVIPTEHVLRELKRLGLVGELPSRKAGAVSWTEIGPDNIGGRTRAILIDPSSSSILYLAAVGGGVWKSTNSGGSWTSTTDANGNIAFTSLGMAPGGTSATRTIYGTTGEGYGNIDAIAGAGLYRTTNSGSSWVQVKSAGTFGTYYLNKVVVDPSDANYIYIGSNNGLWRSTNGGSTFSQLAFSGSKVQDLYLHPTVPDTIWLAVNSSGIHKAPDIKAASPTFTNIRSYSGQKRCELAAAPSKPSVLYVMFMNASSEPSNFDYTGDGGTTWSSATIPTNDDGNLTSYINGQGWYNNTVAVNPSDELDVIIGGVDSYHSTNAGATWSKLTSWRGLNAPEVHADIHDIQYVSSTTFYMANDGGIYKTADGGSSWSSVNTDFAVTQFYYGAMSNTGSDYLGGTQDNGTLLKDAGNSWTEVYGGDGGASIISHSNSSDFFASYIYGKFYFSSNGGASWENRSLPGSGSSSNYLFIAPVEQSPSNAGALYGGGTSFYRTTNSGSSWSSLDAAPSTSKISALVASVTGDTLVYGTNQGHVRRSTDAGATWSTIGPSGPTYITDVDVCHSNANVCYITASGYTADKHIYRTTNLGSASPSWTDVSTTPALPALSVAIERSNENHVLVGYEAGIYETTDGGANWSTANTGMVAAASVEDIDTRYDGNVVAFTHGRGVFASSAPLPVELSAFTVLHTRDGAKLFWMTTTEINNYGFNVQRRTGTTWETIGFVRGNGTSNTPSSYSFIDHTPMNVKVRYRLEQIDRDGTITYSPERKIDPSAIDHILRISSITPQPASKDNPLTIQFTVAEPLVANIQLLDITGRPVFTSAEQSFQPGIHDIHTPLIGFSNGYYLLRVGSATAFDIRSVVMTK